MKWKPPPLPVLCNKYKKYTLSQKLESIPSLQNQSSVLGIVPYALVDMYQHLRGSCCLHLYPELGGNVLFHNAGTCLPNYLISLPRRLQSWFLPLWEHFQFCFRLTYVGLLCNFECIICLSCTSHTLFFFCIFSFQTIKTCSLDTE
jgi:hypothetical protein